MIEGSLDILGAGGVGAGGVGGEAGVEEVGAIGGGGGVSEGARQGDCGACIACIGGAVGEASNEGGVGGGGGGGWTWLPENAVAVAKTFVMPVRLMEAVPEPLEPPVALAVAVREAAVVLVRVGREEEAFPPEEPPLPAVADWVSGGCCRWWRRRERC